GSSAVSRSPPPRRPARRRDHDDRLLRASPPAGPAERRPRAPGGRPVATPESGLSAGRPWGAARSGTYLRPQPTWRSQALSIGPAWGLADTDRARLRLRALGQSLRDCFGRLGPGK